MNVCQNKILKQQQAVGLWWHFDIMDSILFFEQRSDQTLLTQILQVTQFSFSKYGLMTLAKYLKNISKVIQPLSLFGIPLPVDTLNATFSEIYLYPQIFLGWQILPQAGKRNVLVRLFFEAPEAAAYGFCKLVLEYLEALLFLDNNSSRVIHNFFNVFFYNMMKFFRTIF